MMPNALLDTEKNRFMDYIDIQERSIKAQEHYARRQSRYNRILAMTTFIVALIAIRPTLESYLGQFTGSVGLGFFILLIIALLVSIMDVIAEFKES